MHFQKKRRFIVLGGETTMVHAHQSGLIPQFPTQEKHNFIEYSTRRFPVSSDGESSTLIKNPQREGIMSGFEKSAEQQLSETFKRKFVWKKEGTKLTLFVPQNVQTTSLVTTLAEPSVSRLHTGLPSDGILEMEDAEEGEQMPEMDVLKAVQPFVDEEKAALSERDASFELFLASFKKEGPYYDVARGIKEVQRLRVDTADKIYVVGYLESPKSPSIMLLASEQRNLALIRTRVEGAIAANV